MPRFLKIDLKESFKRGRRKEANLNNDVFRFQYERQALDLFLINLKVKKALLKIIYMHNFL